jgi:hypothetical protein
MSTVTQWFPPDTKPVHVGVYPTSHALRDFRYGDYQFQYWNGKGWGAISPSVNAAKRFKNGNSAFQAIYWRGLALPPKEQP